MKITHTDIYRFSIKMQPFQIATGTMYYAQNVLIRLHTDEGLTGVGECSAFPMIVGETQGTCMVLAADFARLWKGKDPLQLETRMEELHELIAFNSTIKSAFDMALYDLSAKAAGLPLYKYLGGTKRDIETDITIGIGSPEVMAQKAVDLVKQGARILKIKLGKVPAEDVARITAIRQAIGPECTIRIDANQGWSYDDAVTALKGLEIHDIQFCEQPMRKWNDYRLPSLREQTTIKIMADESCYDHHDAERLAAADACDFINIKLSKSGGILEALKIHESAVKNNIPCMMGGMLESRIALSAKLHFAYACDGIKFYDLDTCLLGHLEDPCIGGVEFTGFSMNINETPGIGADADESFLKRCECISV